MIPGQFIILAISILLSIAIVLFMKTVHRTGFSLHLVLVPGVALMGTSLLWLFINGTNSMRIGAAFFMTHCVGLPLVVGWGEAFTKRMKAIAARGDFQVGLPAPSRGHLLLGMFGQFYQDLVESIVAVEGSDKLNNKLRELGKKHPIFLYTSIGDDGEFKVDEEIFFQIGHEELECEGFLEFLDDVIQLNSSYLSGSSSSDIRNILNSKVARTLEKFTDLLIEENLLDRLGKGIFSERASTGLIDFDKATGRGLPKRTATLLCSPHPTNGNS